MQILKASEMKNEKTTMLIYAPPGMGKTTLLGELPGRTLIIDVDKGTSVLRGNPRVDIVKLGEDTSGLREALEYLQERCEYDNVCIDSLSELERGMLTVYGREGKNDGAPELTHYNKTGYKIMDYCRLFRALPANIFFTAWEAQSEIVQLTGEKFTQARPMLSGKTADSICGLCDAVGRILISPKDGERYVWLEGSMTAVAKDRLYKRQYCTFKELIPLKEAA